ncbi:SDR family NAD(P)-dependent oxidoreductase [Quadrisphaera sp. RL12-1S]|nr:SDR family NAD(P)-dependent oxidoreductase [Quadrisphaera sp. RL12-1S]
MAVVTGGGSGIGAALARALGDRGVRPVVADVDLGAARAVAAQTGGRAERVDVADPAQVEQLARSAPDARWLFLNAGVLGEHLGAPWEVPAEDWRRVLDINLGGVVNGLRAFVPRLLATGEPAHVVITASLAGAAVFGGGGAYGPSKHAVLAVARHAAMALEGTPVRVHAVCPDLVRTGMSPEGMAPEEVAAHALALVDGGGFAWVPPVWRDAVRTGAAALAGGEAPRPPEPTRPAAALLLNGTVGAGKSTTAEQLGHLLDQRGAAHARVDLDELRRAWPAPAHDPFQQELALANLRDVAANLRRAGAQRLVLAGVLEDRASRERCERALESPLVVVRLRADVATVRERLQARHADDDGLRWHLDRCAELHGVLEAAGVDDHVVDVDGMGPAEVAAAVLRVAGWDAQAVTQKRT